MVGQKLRGPLDKLHVLILVCSMKIGALATDFLLGRETAV